MATFDHRIGPDGKMVYRVRIRRKGYATQTATFPKLSEAKKWAQMTEGSVLEGRHFPIPEAKQHTLADLINRYRHEVLPHKKLSTIKTQRQHLCWWQTHLRHYLLADMTPAVLVEYRSILAHGRANATVVRYLGAPRGAQAHAGQAGAGTRSGAGRARGALVSARWGPDRASAAVASGAHGGATRGGAAPRAPRPA